MIVTDFDCFLLKSITTTNLATRPPTSSLERPSSLWGVLCFLQCSPRSVLEKWTNKAQPPGTDLVWRIIVDINSASQNICLYFTLIPTTYAAYYWCLYAPWHVGKSYHRAAACLTASKMDQIIIVSHLTHWLGLRWGFGLRESLLQPADTFWWDF